MHNSLPALTTHTWHQRRLMQRFSHYIRVGYMVLGMSTHTHMHVYMIRSPSANLSTAQHGYKDYNMAEPPQHMDCKLEPQIINQTYLPVYSKCYCIAIHHHGSQL